MPYGFDLKYLDGLDDSPLLKSGGDNSLIVVKDNTIYYRVFPISLVYQNNQDRQIALNGLELKKLDHGLENNIYQLSLFL